VHLSALTKYHQRRKAQLLDLCKSLEEGLRDEHCDDVFIMGDFNFHNEHENSSIPDDYRDVWSAIRSGM
jgi:hypothetical protein